jgi:hypothetical protein
MRLAIPCMECQKQFGAPTGQFSDFEFRDDGLYKFTCSFGHEGVTVLQQQRFELLFEIGAYAILDGYYREAVSSFTAGIERFYEYALRILLEAKSEALFENCWKAVASQSERQLGAFIFSWAAQFGEAPRIAAASQVELRNRVIHKGLIPTKAEATKYGDSALEMIRPQLRLLQNRLPEEVRSVLQRYLKTSVKASNSTATVSTMSMATLLQGDGGDPSQNNPTVEQYVKRLAEWTKILNSTLGPRSL